MTCREKLKIEHPNLISDNDLGGCEGCPSSYGYLRDPANCHLESEDFIDMEEKDRICTSCWGRELPDKKSEE